MFGLCDDHVAMDVISIAFYTDLCTIPKKQNLNSTIQYLLGDCNIRKALIRYAERVLNESKYPNLVSRSLILNLVLQ